MSQFAKLFDAVKSEPEKTKSNNKKVRPQKVKKSTVEKSETATISRKQLPPFVKNEKSIGKSRRNDYTQVLTYINQNTHREVKKLLIDDPHRRDLSDLVEQLLREWLNQERQN